MTENNMEHMPESDTKIDLGMIRIAPQEFRGENLILSVSNPPGNLNEYRVKRMNISHSYKDENGVDCGGNLVVYIENSKTNSDDRIILKSQWKIASQFITIFNRYFRQNHTDCAYFTDGTPKTFGSILGSFNPDLKSGNKVLFVQFNHKVLTGKYGEFTKREISFSDVALGQEEE